MSPIIKPDVLFRKHPTSMSDASIPNLHNNVSDNHIRCINNYQPIQKCFYN